MDQSNKLKLTIASFAANLNLAADLEQRKLQLACAATKLASSAKRLRADIGAAGEICDPIHLLLLLLLLLLFSQTKLTLHDRIAMNSLPRPQFFLMLASLGGQLTNLSPATCCYLLRVL